jgi:hypothetical protein
MSIESILKEAHQNERFARAVEQIVGGTPTGRIEEGDVALIESFIAVHGEEMLLTSAHRFVGMMAQQENEDAIAQDAMRVAAEADTRLDTGCVAPEPTPAEKPKKTRKSQK